MSRKIKRQRKDDLLTESLVFGDMFGMFNTFNTPATITTYPSGLEIESGSISRTTDTDESSYLSDALDYEDDPSEAEVNIGPSGEIQITPPKKKRRRKRTEAELLANPNMRTSSTRTRDTPNQPPKKKGWLSIPFMQ